MFAFGRISAYTQEQLTSKVRNLAAIGQNYALDRKIGKSVKCLLQGNFCL